MEGALENHCTALDEDTVVELIELTLLKWHSASQTPMHWYRICKLQSKYWPICTTNVLTRLTALHFYSEREKSLILIRYLHWKFCLFTTPLRNTLPVTVSECSDVFSVDTGVTLKITGHNHWRFTRRKKDKAKRQRKNPRNYACDYCPGGLIFVCDAFCGKRFDRFQEFRNA